MQTLGYLISALGPIYLEWFCFEKIFTAVISKHQLCSYSFL